MSDDPVAEYKRLLDSAHQAARAHKARERARAQELAEKLRAASKEITAARARETDVAKEITGWWSNETRHLSTIEWLDLKPPSADPAAEPGRLTAHLAEIEPKTSAFRVALRRAVWPRKLP